MIMWIKILQAELDLDQTGVFDKATLSAVINKKTTATTIKLVQHFLNDLGNLQIPITGRYDPETREMITYFMKEYSGKYGTQFTTRIDESFWKTVASYLNDKER